MRSIVTRRPRRFAAGRPPGYSPPVEDSVVPLIEACRRDWPEVKVSAADLSRALAERGAEVAECHPDLVLALASMAGDPGALRAVASLLDEIAPVLSRMQGSADASKAALRQVRTRVFTSAEGPASLLARYGGGCPLRAWLTAVVVQAATVTGEKDLEEDSGIYRLVAPDLGRRSALGSEAGHYQVTEAMAALTVGERNLLRLHYLDGLTIDILGDVLGTDRNTVARWLLDARVSLRDRVSERLRADLEPPPNETLDLSDDSAP